MKASRLGASPCRVTATLDGISDRGGLEVAVFAEPAGQALGDGAGGAEQFVAGHHLADYEVAGELAEVLGYLVGAENFDERASSLMANAVSQRARSSGSSDEWP